MKSLNELVCTWFRKHVYNITENDPRIDILCIEITNHFKELYEVGIHIKGWKCYYCGVFNGEEMNKIYRCRCCDEPKVDRT